MLINPHRAYNCRGKMVQTLSCGVIDSQVLFIYSPLSDENVRVGLGEISVGQ